MTKQDVVLVFVSVIGTRNGRLEQESYAKKIYAQEVNGQLLSAIQLTTASGICAMVDMVVEGKLPQKAWFVRNKQAWQTSQLTASVVTTHRNSTISFHR